MLTLWIILGVFLCWKFLCNHSDNAIKKPIGKAEKKVEIPVNSAKKVAIGATTLGLWNFADGANFSASSKQHIQFLRDSSAHISPISADLDNELLSMINYMNENPNRSLTITGYYKEGEKNDSVLPNLGLARANKFKKYLIEMGAPSNQLANASRIMPVDWFEGNILKKGIDFKFGKIANVKDDLAEIKKSVKANPIVLYFETNDPTIDLNSDQRQAFADIIRYLDNVKGSKLLISGHTDSMGDSATNKRLSRKRAEFVQEYLWSNGGISKKSSLTKDYGETKPIASNKTKKGRALNRRVEITFK